MVGGQRDGEGPSGKQFAISEGSSRAVVTEVGGGLRELSVGDTDLVWGYGVNDIAGGGRGQVLAPWPNRIEDGSYAFEGRQGLAPLDEPDKSNAIHGLVRWLYWQLDRHESHAVSLSCELAPQPAYPWHLRLTVEYALTGAGVVVTASALNLSGETAPFGLGFHPYLNAGAGGADVCRLTLAASDRLVVDERAIPRSRQAVEGTRFDFRSGRSLEGIALDDCFTGLALEVGAGGGSGGHLPEGAAWEAVLDRPDARLGLWGGTELGYAMCYTGDTLGATDRRRGVAVEPMTCPPNAFRSGEALVRLGSGEPFEARWGIRLLG